MLALGIPLTFDMARFCKFMITEIFPGGRLPSVRMIDAHAVKPGFTRDPVPVAAVALPHDTRPLVGRAGSAKDEAIAVQSQEVYDRYMKYLVGCPPLFRSGLIDVGQFTLTK